MRLDALGWTRLRSTGDEALGIGAKHGDGIVDGSVAIRTLDQAKPGTVFED
jgi:hypothetical protein